MQILCATDFSPVAVIAADIAAAMARKWALPLRLVHCGQNEIVMGDLPVVAPDDPAEHEQLKREEERLCATGITVVAEFRHGAVCGEICSAAVERPTRLIVLGSTYKSRAERWLLGSAAEYVAESATVPTLIVRQPDTLRAWLSEGAALRLLCGVDFSASADTAVAALRPFLQLGNVDIEAVHVQPETYPALSKAESLIHEGDLRERVRSVLGDVTVKVHVCHAADHPEMEFLHQVTAQSTGMIVVGMHQRHGLRRLLSPSFSRGVLAHAQANVLCVPATLGDMDTHIPRIHRVLVAMNFTPLCTEALRHAHSLLPWDGSLHVVHVCQEPTRGINPIIASEVYFDHSLATAAEKRAALEKMQTLPAALLTSLHITITTEVLAHENIATALCEAAERVGADVICMGTKGHSRTSVALLGSTVQAVLARAHKPVFIATPPLA